MAKDKKKEKKEKKGKREKEVDQKKAEIEALSTQEEKGTELQKKDQEYSLDSALKASKTTESTLQDLLFNVSKGDGFYSREKFREENVEPRLSIESKKDKIVEDYLIEDVPISERKLASMRPKKVKEGMLLETSEPDSEKSIQIKEKSQIPQPPPPSPLSLSPNSPSALNSQPAPRLSPPLSPQPYDHLLSVSGEDDIYSKLAKFFVELFEGYNEQYARWENSISSILTILRKSRKITKKNTEDLESSINNMYEKIQVNLEQFKIKRDEIERQSDVDVENLSNEFKKVLGLLGLQIKEYQLKKEMDDLIHQYKTIY